MECKTTGKDTRTQKEEEILKFPTKGGKRIKHKTILA